MVFLKWTSLFFAITSPIMAVFLLYAGAWLPAITWVLLTMVWMLNYWNCTRSIQWQRDIDKLIEEMKL